MKNLALSLLGVQAGQAADRTKRTTSIESFCTDSKDGTHPQLSRFYRGITDASWGPSFFLPRHHWPRNLSAESQATGLQSERLAAAARSGTGADHHAEVVETGQAAAAGAEGGLVAAHFLFRGGGRPLSTLRDGRDQNELGTLHGVS